MRSRGDHRRRVGGSVKIRLGIAPRHLHIVAFVRFRRNLSPAMQMPRDQMDRITSQVSPLYRHIAQLLQIPRI